MRPIDGRHHLGTPGCQRKEDVVMRKLLAQLARWFGKKKA